METIRAIVSEVPDETMTSSTRAFFISGANGAMIEAMYERQSSVFLVVATNLGKYLFDIRTAPILTL